MISNGFCEKSPKIFHLSIFSMYHRMAQIVFLGTSAATPTKARNLASCALRLHSGEILVFDAGEDIQRRFEAAKLRFNVPTTILISHLHGDHIIGLPGLLFNFHLNGRNSPLTIIGPQGIAAYLMVQYQTIGLHAPNYDLTLHEIQYPTKDAQTGVFQIIEYKHFLTPAYERKTLKTSDYILLKTKAYTIYGREMQHSVFTLGYRLEEAPYNGKFDPKQAIALKIPKGRLWKHMQEGKSITLEDGTQIDPVKEKIVSPKRPGLIISYSGDTTYCSSLVTLAKNADYFICECTYSTDDEKLAIEKAHMSTRMAAEAAKEAQVMQLALTHFSSRYKDVMVLQKEAQLIFPATIAAYDLLSISIKPRE